MFKLRKPLSTSKSGGGAESPTQLRARLLTVIAALIIVLTVVACTAPAGDHGNPPPAANANLYLSLGEMAQGLYVVDTTTGKATKVPAGDSLRALGLSPSELPTRLFAGAHLDIYTLERDGTNRKVVMETGPLTEGLAYDPDQHLLYASSNGYVYVRSAATGEVLETLFRPPNAYDFEGLAFDPQERLLYGLIRGTPQQPQFDHDLQLHSLDVDEAGADWQVVGSTQGHWAGAGLAFDLENRVLYATGRQGDLGGLYRIDPATGATTRVGATGLTDASGGLAWLPTLPD